MHFFDPINEVIEESLMLVYEKKLTLVHSFKYKLNGNKKTFSNTFSTFCFSYLRNWLHDYSS